MPTIQEYRDALGTALGLITKHGLAVNLAAKEPEDFARLKAARVTAAAPHDATDAAPSAPQTPAPDYEAMARAAGYDYAADSSGEMWWMRVPYDPDATSPFFETAKDVCEAPDFEPARSHALTSDLGLAIRDALEGLRVPLYDLDQDDAPVIGSDDVDPAIDASDASNLRLQTASGARFVVRVIREG
jgi:hypothetical protein